MTKNKTAVNAFHSRVCMVSPMWLILIFIVQFVNGLLVVNVVRVRVDLRALDARVSEHLLDNSYRGDTHKPGCEGVSQKMWVDGPAKRSVAGSADDPLHLANCERRGVMCFVKGGTSYEVQQFRPPKILHQFDGFAEPGGYRNRAFVMILCLVGGD